MNTVEVSVGWGITAEGEYVALTGVNRTGQIVTFSSWSLDLEDGRQMIFAPTRNGVFSNPHWSDSIAPGEKLTIYIPLAVYETTLTQAGMQRPAMITPKMKANGQEYRGQKEQM